MTREEAKAKLTCYGYGENNECLSDAKIIDEIYDYFESRICQNCRYLKYVGKSYKSCEMLGINIGYDSQQDFYCQFFERR